MPPRNSQFPHAIERSALQRLVTGQSLSLIQLHPAGKKTVASMLAKGWIVGDTFGSERRYRITAAGEAAFSAKIPRSK